jgi:hypothetical protein
MFSIVRRTKVLTDIIESKDSPLKKIRLIVSIALLSAVIFLCHQIITLSLANQVDQQDYAEINDIKYGLFSINQWKIKLSLIINEEISKFDVSGDDKKQLKPMVEKQLDKLIDNVYEKITAANQKSFKGRVKQVFIDTFVDMKDIKAGIPGYADDVIKLLERPTTKTQVKGMLLERVEDYFQKTFENQDMTQVNKILVKLGDHDIPTTKQLLDEKIARNIEGIYKKTWLMIGLSVLIFIFGFFSRKNLWNSEYLIMVATLFALLVAGVTTPMINLEAKITEMSFVLFDQPVSFLNQVLYFQTKSVLDVFWIMIIHEQLQMKLVGVLMIVFSIIFPVLKLLSSVIYFQGYKLFRRNRLIRFLVLKSGKWSMTDVLIIAIFMAYIGFNGIISSQFGKLHTGDNEIVLLTTNGTSLQSGFYLFLAYVVLAMFLTEFLSHDKPQAETAEVKDEVAAEQPVSTML